MPRSETKAAQVAARLMSQISDGRLPPGSRLPSLRQASGEFGVSKNTMVEAYDRLVAQGVLVARAGAGFYVQPRRILPQPPAAGRLKEAADAASLLTEQLERRFRTRIGEGRPSAEWHEGAVITKHLRMAITEGGGGLRPDYDPPSGYAALRKTLATRLSERSIDAGTDNVLLTLGANHAFDLIIRQYLRLGDAVLVDSPGYYPLFAKLKLAGLTLIPVPRGPHGPDPQALARAAETSGARFFFTQSLAHNPTGTSLNMSTAGDILRIADRFDLTIIEDDIFGDLMPPTAPRLAALDRLRRVLLVSSFSKTLPAGLRVGYIAGPPALMAELCSLKMLTVVNSCGYSERIVHAVLTDGSYRRHIRTLQARVRNASAQATTLAARLRLSITLETEGGYYGWLRLPEGTDDLALARQAATQDIFLAPGSIFFPSGVSEGGNWLRLNIAYAGDPHFAAFMESTLGP
ncbi:MAG: PLP-dependent aminotransferase family protein [Paracoccus sp. (in: a-proteobacteria)]|uniref:aminotransferase-like domain-containing protein n=1 Tax=Paracoccus sp. TaxID=267 RepID=UPI0026DFB01C|nr:PLP-dependent aminotransferase family protein [Paracoccus sp. (in: a-proteobacteria)]MDO5622936.1 PLP-dependent aminotransferase family protein [Paracoccus sp. (in: a-proteobacteria)]